MAAARAKLRESLAALQHESALLDGVSDEEAQSLATQVQRLTDWLGGRRAEPVLLAKLAAGHGPTFLLEKATSTIRAMARAWADEPARLERRAQGLAQSATLRELAAAISCAHCLQPAHDHERTQCREMKLRLRECFVLHLCALVPSAMTTHTYTGYMRAAFGTRWLQDAVDSKDLRSVFNLCVSRLRAAARLDEAEFFALLRKQFGAVTAMTCLELRELYATAAARLQEVTFKGPRPGSKKSHAQKRMEESVARLVDEQ